MQCLVTLLHQQYLRLCGCAQLRGRILSDMPVLEPLLLGSLSFLFLFE